jgi:hypothetical protein
MPEQLVGIPAAITEALNRLKEELARAAGQNLAGIILYGGLARGRYRPGKSDINVLVLLHDVSANAMTVIAPALQAAWRSAAVEPMLLTPAEVPRVANTFPIKFLDIKKYHVVLAGTDPLSDLDVPREHVRLRIEQEFSNLLLRLRTGYIRAGSDRTILARRLTRAARPFALELAALLQLAGKEVPAEDRSAAIYEAAASALGLDREPLARLAALRQDPRPSSDIHDLYRGVLEALTRARDIAAQMKEAPR